ncbi:hypothetical protein D1B31_15755 [Neobacillus notoginsengisoli]|uniref:YwpF-like family protein n=1 Tax=Neobacillus notoginsengisoli TaxID=1578198 RepID=A0A417YR65_9BACI|nr:YwpF family protein [Neobacillus notoginsengisoli]RHW37226.1 hypothetical protein D1B31_15755 [Neobacillus notoginsengisoli]
MKTFRLVSLGILDNEDMTEIPLESGLIINKEDEQANWLIEAYTDISFYEYFKKIEEKENEFIVQVNITSRENDPAFFQTRLCTLKKFERHISVLLEGRLRKTRTDYAELLLGQLLDKGLDGDTLLDEFRDQLKKKPKIKPNA